VNEINVKRIVALLEMKTVLLNALVEENDRLTRKVRDLEDDYEFIVSGTRPNEEAPDQFCVTLENGDCVSEDPRCMHQVPKDSEHVPDAAMTSSKKPIDLTDPANADWPFDEA